MTRPAWLAAVADELGTDADSWRETVSACWRWQDDVGNTWTVTADSVAVDGNVSVRVEVVGLAPAHLPRLAQAARAAVDAVRLLAVDAGPG